MATWYNNDGLVVKFTPSDFRKFGGEFCVTTGLNHIWSWNIDLSLFAAGTYLLSDGLKLPKGYEWERAEIYVDKAGASGTSVAIGGYNTDQTADNAAGFITAANGALANLTNGATVTGTGTYVGTKSSKILIPSMTVVGTFSAGNIQVRLHAHPSTDPT